MKSTLDSVIALLLLGFSAAAQTNEWTKSTDGSWDERHSWSLIRLPGVDQQLVAFDNTGSKTVTIDNNTTARYPDSLSLNNLLIGAAGNATNQLLLNFAGLSVPLSLRSNLSIGTNSSLVSHSSALQAAKAYIDGSLSISDASTADLNQVWLHSGGAVYLTDGTMTISNLIFDQATITQSGGSVSVQNVELPEYFANTISSGPASYNLEGGVLTSQNLLLGNSVFVNDLKFGAVSQTGGIHTNSEMVLAGVIDASGHRTAGDYLLYGGLLISGQVRVMGEFDQSAGTNLIQQLSLDGGNYYLYGGKLVTSNMDLNGGSLYLNSDGTVSNSGTLTLSVPYNYLTGIYAYTATEPQYFGQLQVTSGGFLEMHGGFPYQPPTAPAVFRFADSHAVPWGGLLQIWDWGVNPGDHIYFGTNAQALTAAQLAQIVFVQRNGGRYPVYSARLLATGELVPAVPPPIDFTTQASPLVLSWPGGYELQSATNLNGPYLPVSAATSPFTNTFTDQWRFFRLHLPSP